MAALAVLLVMVGVAATRYVFQQWLGSGEPLLKEDAEQQETEKDATVEIVVQESANERRGKLSLPDLSSIQIRSPVRPMKSSIRSALKELRARQMVQSLCSKFEARMKLADEDEEDEPLAKQPAREVRPLPPPQQQQAKSRRGDAVVAPVLLDVQNEGQAKRSGTPTSMRSNNLNKFLRCYASNLDNAVFVDPAAKPKASVGETTEALVARTEDMEVVAPRIQAHAAFVTTEDTKVKSPTPAKNSKRTVRLELDLPPLALEFSNQNGSPASPESLEATPLLQTASHDVAADEHDVGDNNTAATRDESDVADDTPLLSVAFTSTDPDAQVESMEKRPVQEQGRVKELAPESSVAPPRKSGIARFQQFQQRVPANALRPRVPQ